MRVPNPFHLRRRSFVRTAAIAAAASTLPGWFLEQETQAAGRTQTLSPNDQPGIALVGCGGMGRGDARSASRFGRIVALCDVDEARLAEARKLWPDATPYRDFRRVMDRHDVHAVLCGTVDHWHALVSIAAMRAGKDVYCEKPLTRTIDEGKRLVSVARKTGRILQTGSQQRSDRNFRLACELVQNGRIGTLEQIDVWLPAGRREGPFRSTQVPAGMDYDFWMGPTQPVDYVKERTHVSFRYWWDYSGGTMTDWGAHHNDIALWALGPAIKGPASIEGRSTVEMIPGGFSAASEYDVTYRYSNGVIHRCRSTVADNPSGGVVTPDGQRHGIKFNGSHGWIWVTRGSLQASHPELLTTPLSSHATRLEASNDHMGNFFDCLRSRKRPICDVEIGHRSASLCHLGVLAIRLGRPLKWDVLHEQFADDRNLNQWLNPAMRKGWGYELVS